MKPFRIATLNCLNLALPGRRFYAGVEPYSPDEYIAKTQWLAGMLDRLAADLVLVQEVFHEQALADVVSQSAGGARRWSLAAPRAGEGNDRPRLGLVWRQPLQPVVESMAEFPDGLAVPVPEAAPATAFSRPLLRAELVLPEFGAQPLTVFNVHLKSRRPDLVDGEGEDDPAALARGQLRSLIRRGAEAAALRRIVGESARRPAAPLIIAGDFNDAAGAVTTRIVADPSWVLEGGPGSGAGVLYDAFDVQQRPVGHCRAGAFTIVQGGVPERIDHVLVSAAFVPPSAHAVGCVASVEVLGDHLIERRRAAESGVNLQRVYSDHAAVCVSLEPIG